MDGIVINGIFHEAKYSQEDEYDTCNKCSLYGDCDSISYYPCHIFNDGNTIFEKIEEIEALGGLVKPNKIMNEIKLGDKVRSSVSGFSGTVTAKCEYLHGNTSYGVTASSLVNGEVKTEWFQASELEALD